jgi:hypothetical protein
MQFTESELQANPRHNHGFEIAAPIRREQSVEKRGLAPSESKKPLNQQKKH